MKVLGFVTAIALTLVVACGGKGEGTKDEFQGYWQQTNQQFKNGSVVGPLVPVDAAEAAMISMSSKYQEFDMFAGSSVCITDQFSITSGRLIAEPAAQCPRKIDAKITLYNDSTNEMEIELNSGAGIEIRRFQKISQDAFNNQLRTRNLQLQ